METLKRILDYGYYCDVVELNYGSLRIDVDAEQIEHLRHDFASSNFEELNEVETFPAMFEEFDYLDFIPDLGNQEVFAVLTSSPAFYQLESGKLWWYPDYQIHNIFQKLIENKSVTFTLANKDSHD